MYSKVAENTVCQKEMKHKVSLQWRNKNALNLLNSRIFQWNIGINMIIDGNTLLLKWIKKKIWYSNILLMGPNWYVKQQVATKKMRKHFFLSLYS